MAVMLGVLVAVSYGAADFIGGLASRRLPTAVVMAATQSIGLALVVATAFVVSGHANGADLLRGAGAGVAGFSGVALLYRGLARGLMSVVAPITAVGAGVGPVVWGVLSGERPSPIGWAGLAAATVAVVLISGTGQGTATAIPRRELVLALLAGAAFGAVFILLGDTSPASGVLPVVAARCVTVPVALAWALQSQRRNPRRMLRTSAEDPSRVGLMLPLGGVLDAMANVVFIAAARRGLLSEVSVVSALYPGATVVLARVVLGERLGRPQALGLGLALAGVVLIAI